MSEYIDRYKAMDEINEWLDSVGNVMIGKGLSYYGELIGCLQDVPTADVAEIRHGKWLDCIEAGISPAGIKVTGMTGYKCSLCGRYEGKKEPYCNCGAKMDLEE